MENKMKADQLLDAYPELDSAVILTSGGGDSYVLMMSTSKLMPDGKTGIYLGLFFQNNKTGAEKYKVEEEKVDFIDEGTLFGDLLESMTNKDYLINDLVDVDDFKAKLLHGRLMANAKKDLATAAALAEEPISTAAVFEWGKKKW